MKCNGEFGVAEDVPYGPEPSMAMPHNDFSFLIKRKENISKLLFPGWIV